MSEEQPQMLDIRVSIDGPTEGLYRVFALLFEYGSYPPKMRRREGQIVFDNVTPSDRFRAHIITLGREHFSSNSLHSLLDLLLGPEHLALVSREGNRDRLRVTFEYDDPKLDFVPWESLTLQGAWRLRDRCAIVRRYRAEAVEFSSSLRLPIDVSIVNFTFPGIDMAEMLFDGFTKRARELGGIRWGSYSSGDPVVHIVFDSSSVAEVVTLPEEITRWPTARPRLLVLHNLSATLDERLIEVMRQMLRLGAGAVLLATQNVSESPFFFHTFYRKMMHNFPLDACVREALHTPFLDSPPQDALFMARKDGEFGLLLDRAVLEDIRPLDFPDRAKSIARSARPRRVRRGISREKPFGVAGESATELKNLLRDRVVSRLQSEQDWLFNSARQRLKEITFDEEEHGVYQTRQASEELQARARELELRAEALSQANAEALSAELTRWTNLWLTEQEREPPAVVAQSDPLVTGRPYQLHLQIGPRRGEAAVAVALDERPLKKAFETHEALTLDVMFFCTSTDFELAGDDLESTTSSELPSDTVEDEDSAVAVATMPLMSVVAHAKLVLPRFGATKELLVNVTPQQAGLKRLRTCIYYGNVMLQSLIFETEVVEMESDGVNGADDTIRNTTRTDYLATTDFALLDELPQPSLNLFTNKDANGTHWIGVFSSGDASAFGLKNGDMAVFKESTLEKGASKVRECLAEIQGPANYYKFSGTVPLSSQNIQLREGYLCKLADSGWSLFHSLFEAVGSDNTVEMGTKFRQRPQESEIISIARCGTDGATVPWGAMYTNPLDTHNPQPKKLCEIFKQQVAANVWDTTGPLPVLKEKKDLLDDPVACRNQPGCPLEDPQQRRLTVCPFGFWGMVHQIEQPLQQVATTPRNEIPEALSLYHQGQTSFLTLGRLQQTRIALGLYAGIDHARQHSADIKALGQSSSADVESEDTRQKILKMMEDGKQHVYYFYCHGQSDGNTFLLKVGAPGEFIGSSDLDPQDYINTWSTPRPLVVMNACETVATTPDVTHGFVYTLKRMGAVGVVGTEIKVSSLLAQPVGLQLLGHLLNRMSIGEAFLELRKYFLRQLNPLVLAYSYYSPATLHLHVDNDCHWCTSRRKAEKAPAS